jgi:exopolyphosphatase/guanosine-5'-triphosphate,3'-diphosphate pyrophosphatase
MGEGKSEQSRRESVLQLRRHYDEDPDHSRRVARLALRLFDQTSRLHQLDLRSRELLEYACLLHDIGWAGGEMKHKRRSYEMIRSASLEGFSEAEREIMASVARYHGAKPPREHHVWNHTLSPGGKKEIRYLSAIIRIADALDRSHSGAVEDVECTVGEDEIILKLKVLHQPHAELWALARKKGYFEEVLGVKMVVR